MGDFLARYKADHTNKINRALHSVGIPMIVVSLVAVFFDWRWGLGLFVGGWILQFIGHWFEGKTPSFFKDPKFLVVGVAWWLEKMRGKKAASATIPSGLPSGLPSER